MKCGLRGLKRAVGFGALALCLRASFPSPKILLMTALSQEIRSLNPSKARSQAYSKAAPKGKHVQLFKMRCKVRKGFYSTPADAPNGQ